MDMLALSVDEKNFMKRVSPRRELQGPRPPPLKVGKESCKIMKKPLTTSHPPPHQPGRKNDFRRQPVVIHLKSPEIIHTRPQDFMNLVQQLTGKPASSSLVPRSSSSSLSLSSSSSPLSSSTNGFPNSSVNALMVDDNTASEIIASIDLDKGLENKEVKEDHMLFGHEVALSLSPLPSSMPSNTSPVFPSLFLSSPNAFTNWLDFGPVY